MPAGAKQFKKWVPEGFKSRFDLLERWSSTRAFDWCALRHQSFDLRRVTAILLQQKNFGPKKSMCKVRFCHRCQTVGFNGE